MASFVFSDPLPQLILFITSLKLALLVHCTYLFLFNNSDADHQTHQWRRWIQIFPERIDTTMCEYDIFLKYILTAILSMKEMSSVIYLDEISGFKFL